MTITVKIIPNAKKTEVVGWEGKALKIRISAPAIEGKANKELIRFLAELCDCSQSEVEIIKGQTSKIKVVDLPADLHEIVI
jgi:hypothetical protein